MPARRRNAPREAHDRPRPTVLRSRAPSDLAWHHLPTVGGTPPGLTFSDSKDRPFDPQAPTPQPPRSGFAERACSRHRAVGGVKRVGPSRDGENKPIDYVPHAPARGARGVPTGGAHTVHGSPPRGPSRALQRPRAPRGTATPAPAGSSAPRTPATHARRSLFTARCRAPHPPPPGWWPLGVHRRCSTPPPRATRSRRWCSQRRCPARRGPSCYGQNDSFVGRPVP